MIIMNYHNDLTHCVPDPLPKKTNVCSSDPYPRYHPMVVCHWCLKKQIEEVQMTLNISGMHLNSKQPYVSRVWDDAVIRIIRTEGKWGNFKTKLAV
jgi:hypothetical protein